MSDNTSTPQSTSSANSSDLPADFKVYKPPLATSNTNVPNLPDSYFTPTAADLKAAQATLSARTQALTNAPLQLRAAREAEEKAKRDRWPNITIRVKFPDRTQLEKVFPSTDKIRSIYAFVRSSLRDDVKPIKFILYQTPPKRDLRVSDPNVRDLTLAQLQLAPSSILMLRFEDEHLNSTQMPAPILPLMLEQAIDLPAPLRFDAEPRSPPSGSTSNTPTSNAQSTERKIPKWLKAGLKK
ncbi:hypothetical protein CONPUDRAFT_119806 [Coniophora puteana RWD-64-598 SS2]|uniref:UBX domain-containing protein n=1 Tax=Coniophora puteana (strain RWD-64-598) TaxID=741705 RepID=A0A5M3MYH1_CONPW|nr:uncharacterized protein CONPUDRAFT_119806 [Coniophora puteana RWD-64-598 SS2]EIW84180.1 hypothetical protein CONPUDRAFT_119806 [Coniophora puteana RWD-64-598 SS2]